jgi:D-alanine-D-alanine ligase
MEKVVNIKELNIAVLVGGFSSERDISFKSGQSVLEELRKNGYKVFLVEVDGQDFIKVLESKKVDFCFNFLHGKFGEDGKVQALLEFLGIPYSGSGVCASAIAMDKEKTKLILKATGIPTPLFMAFSPEDIEDNKEYILSLAREKINYPLVLKSPHEGSTIGVKLVDSEEELEGLFEEWFKKYTRLMLEEYIEGREFTVAVLGGEKPEALGVVEIIPEKGFFDLESKYTKGMTKYEYPANIPEGIAAKMRELALLSHQYIGCYGYSRVDFRWDGYREPQVLEINTLPGMTSTSLFPMSASVYGYKFIDILEIMIEHSLLRRKSYFYDDFSKKISDSKGGKSV